MAQTIIRESLLNGEFNNGDYHKLRLSDMDDGELIGEVTYEEKKRLAQKDYTPELLVYEEILESYGEPL